MTFRIILPCQIQTFKTASPSTALIGIFYYCSLMFTKSQKKCFIHIWPIYRCFSGNLSTSYMSGSPFFVFCGYFFEFHLPIDHFLWYNTFSCQICFAYLLVIYLLLLVADQSWLTSQKIYFFLSFLSQSFSIPCKHIVAGKYLLSV